MRIAAIICIFLSGYAFGIAALFPRAFPFIGSFGGVGLLLLAFALELGARQGNRHKLQREDENIIGQLQ